MLTTRHTPQNKRHTPIEGEEMEKYSMQTEMKKKKAGVAILIQNRLQNKTITRDKQCHFIILKGLNEEDITLVNIPVCLQILESAFLSVLE